MTSKDFIRAEAENTDRIILYREGLFWKAYERSAFAVCMQVRPFKPTKRSLKTLGGGELISIGFLSSTEDRVLDGLTRLETEPDRLVLSARRPIVVEEFEAWKASVPLALPRSKCAAGDHPAGSSPHVCAAVPKGVGAAVTCDGVPAMQEQKLLPDFRLRLRRRCPTSRSRRPVSWRSVYAGSILPPRRLWSVCFLSPI